MDDQTVTPRIPLKLNLSAQQYEAALPGTLLFRQAIPIAPGTKTVRAIVVDSGRRAVGSVTITLPSGSR